jgi:hypothetical protein
VDLNGVYASLVLPIVLAFADPLIRFTSADRLDAVPTPATRRDGRWKPATTTTVWQITDAAHPDN